MVAFSRITLVHCPSLGFEHATLSEPFRDSSAGNCAEHQYPRSLNGFHILLGLDTLIDRQSASRLLCTVLTAQRNSLSYFLEKCLLWCCTRQKQPCKCIKLCPSGRACNYVMNEMKKEIYLKAVPVPMLIQLALLRPLRSIAHFAHIHTAVAKYCPLCPYSNGRCRHSSTFV